MFQLKLKLELTYHYYSVGWIGGQYKTKLRLISTQVKVEVEVGVELGNYNRFLKKLNLVKWLNGNQLVLN